MAKKAKGSARTTISIPADLKRRMEKIKEPVNWSAIACQAFEMKLAEFISRQGVKDMEDVVNRLRASKQQSESEDFSRGMECGREWASRRAEVPELKRLQKLFDARSQDSSYTWADFFNSECGSSAYGVDERLYFEIEPSNHRDRNDAYDFWQNVTGGESSECTDDWLRGFAEGALAVWNEVRGQI